MSEMADELCDRTILTRIARGSPVPYCKTQSRKNIWPFHASRTISKMLSRSREIRDDHVSHKNKNINSRINIIFTFSNLSIKLFTLRVWIFDRMVISIREQVCQICVC